MNIRDSVTRHYFAGYEFAMWTSKCAIAKCVREYCFFPADNFEMEVEYQITQKPSKGGFCKIRKR